MGAEIHLAGELARWPPKAEMAAILRAGALAVIVGAYSIRLSDCEHFVFQQYGGDLGDPCIDADASSLDKMLHDAGRVSAALAAADLRHRFELYDNDDRLVGYLHHDWLP